VIIACGKTLQILPISPLSTSRAMNCRSIRSRSGQYRVHFGSCLPRASDRLGWRRRSVCYWPVGNQAGCTLPEKLCPPHQDVAVDARVLLLHSCFNSAAQVFGPGARHLKNVAPRSLAKCERRRTGRKRHASRAQGVFVVIECYGVAFSGRSRNNATQLVGLWSVNPGGLLIQHPRRRRTFSV